MGVSKTWTGLALAGLLGMANPVRADDAGGAGTAVPDTACGESVTAEILGVLLAAGNIDRAQYEALCRRARGEEAAAATPVAAAPAVSAEGPTWSFKWDDGFKLSRSDGAFQLKFGGRVQADTAFISLDGDLEDEFELADIDPNEGSGVQFRRARLAFEGTVYERATFKAEYDFATEGDVGFRDVYMGLLNLGPVGETRVGYFKEPFLLQEATSSNYITFMERGLPSVFFPGRQMGGMVSGNLLENRALWQVGGFRVTDEEGFAFDSWGDESMDIATRLVGVPLYAAEGAQVIHVGAGYIHRFLDDSLRLRSRPESNLAQRFVDTQNSFAAGGDVPANNSDILNLELAGVWGPFSAQTEWTGNWVQGDHGQGDVDFWGTYVEASWFLTGEHRNYDLGKGRFGRIKPKANFDPADGGWGAWELVARFSYSDLDDDGVQGGTFWRITPVVNWHLTDNIRYELTYGYGVLDRFDLRGGTHFFGTRLQFQL